MSGKEKLVSELIEWARLKGVKFDSQNVRVFNDILEITRSDGYKLETLIVDEVRKW